MLRLYRGYPGSGKTTLAQAWVKDEEQDRRRVNRDDIRFMLFGRYANVDEMAVTKAQKALVETFLRQRKDVAIDDTNLKLRNLKNWVQVAYRHGHRVEIVDVTTDVEESVARNLARAFTGGRFVPPEVIEGMAKRYPMPWPKVDLPQVTEPDFRKVDPEEALGLQRALIVDLDGTLAIHNGRSPYDYTQIGTDLLNDMVDGVIVSLSAGTGDPYETMHEIIFLSGRPDSCRKDTEEWLHRQGWWMKDSNVHLFMRRAGDDRADYVVKYEIFDRAIRGKYDVRLVLDDRDQVVDMWRAIGLPTWQVARGDF